MAKTKGELLVTCYSNARRNFEIMCYLSPRQNRPIQKIISEDELLKHWNYLVLKDFFIEVNKIISIQKVKIPTDYPLSGLLVESIERSKLSYKLKVSQKMKLLKLVTTIQTIKNVRDKFYAHLDLDYEKYITNNISIRDMGKLTLTVQGIMVKLYGFSVMQEVLSKIPSYKDYDLIERLKPKT